MASRFPLQKEPNSDGLQPKRPVSSGFDASVQSGARLGGQAGYYPTPAVKEMSSGVDR